MYVKTENRTMLLKGSIHTQQENQGPKVTYLRVALRNSSQLCMLMFPLEENSIYPSHNINQKKEEQELASQLVYTMRDIIKKKKQLF